MRSLTNRNLQRVLCAPVATKDDSSHQSSIFCGLGSTMWALLAAAALQGPTDTCGSNWSTGAGLAVPAES